MFFFFLSRLRDSNVIVDRSFNSFSCVTRVINFILKNLFKLKHLCELYVILISVFQSMFLWDLFPWNMKPIKANVLDNRLKLNLRRFQGKIIAKFLILEDLRGRGGAAGSALGEATPPRGCVFGERSFFSRSS